MGPPGVVTGGFDGADGGIGAVAVGAVGHVLAGPQGGAAVRNVLFGGIVVTVSTALAAGIEALFCRSVGYGVAEDVTVEALETLVRRVVELDPERRTAFARCVAVDADRAVDDLVLLGVLGSRWAHPDQQGETENPAADEPVSIGTI